MPFLSQMKRVLGIQIVPQNGMVHCPKTGRWDSRFSCLFSAIFVQKKVETAVLPERGGCSDRDQEVISPDERRFRFSGPAKKLFGRHRAVESGYK